MLHSKIIPCPDNPDDIEAAIMPIAAMAMDYAIELGIGKTIYNTHGFIHGWMQGTQFVIGVYDGEEIVGMILGRITAHAFTDAKTMVVQTAYLRREHRTASDKYIVDAFATAKAYAKQIDAVNLIIHAEGRMVKPLEKYGGKVGYVAMQFNVED